MKRIWTLSLIVATALTLAACGGGDEPASAEAPTPEPTATPTPTASPEPAVSKPTPAPGKCDEVEYTPKDNAGTVHPGSNFFAPDAEKLPSDADLDHLLLLDNAVVVLYAADTKKRTRDRLYDWTYEDVVERTPVVVPDASPGALPVRARIATVELRCNGFDFKRLTAFANRTDIKPLAGHG